jgi:hypothetical protein
MERLKSTLASALPFSTSHGTTFIVSATVIGTITLLSLSLAYRHRNRVKLIRSPAFTLLPNLSGAEWAALEYPPDVLPGGREVNTPVGAHPHFQVR